jgi:hypothetical protein
MAAVVFIETDHPLGAKRMINAAPRKGEHTGEASLKAVRIQGLCRSGLVKTESADVGRQQGL